MIDVRLRLPDTAAAAALVDLLLAAATRPVRDPRAGLWQDLADGIGDGLDTLPVPRAFDEAQR